MTPVRIVNGAALRRELVEDIAPTLQAMAASFGPNGRAVLYTVGSHVRRAVTGTQIARRSAGSGPSERLLLETLVSADRDLGDGTKRLALMMNAALTAGRRVVESGIHPGELIHAAENLRDELAGHFAAVIAPEADVAGVLRAAALPDAAQDNLLHALSVAGEAGQVELARQTDDGLRLEVVDGFSADMKPLLSGVLAHMDQVHILVVNDILTDFERLAPVIEGFAHSNKSLVVAARGLEGPARQLLERNRKAGVVRVAAITPRDQGPRAADILRDLAIATGATIVDDETGQSLNTVTPAHLGSAATCRRSADQVTFTLPQGDANTITVRLREIENEIHRNRYLALDREHARRRHMRLSGRRAELFVGPDHTDPALFEQMSRALASVHSARPGGTLEGAGAGLARVAALLESVTSIDRTERSARVMMAQALRAPQRILRRNAGLEAPGEVLPSDNLSDPAQLSRDVTAIALSLALQILALETAVIRKRRRPHRKGGPNTRIGGYAKPAHA